MSEVTNPAPADCREPVLKIKQEEAEVEIVEVKEEQVEPSTSELPRLELHQHLAGAGMAIELPVTQQCVQMPSVTEAAFMSVDPCTCELELIVLVSCQFHSCHLLWLGLSDLPFRDNSITTNTINKCNQTNRVYK